MPFEVFGDNNQALFTLKIYRGEGASLLAMNWKNGTPSNDFVGFAIEFQPPTGGQFFPIKNRLNFLRPDGTVDKTRRSSVDSPIQMFRWVHFPQDVNLQGLFTYRVTPRFMDANGQLTSGESQTAAIDLTPETYPGQLNVTFTRGFVSSQAFVDRFCETPDDLLKLIPERSIDGPEFEPTLKDADKALAWMGFEARKAILDLLDEAIRDTTCQVRVISYDCDEKHFIDRLVALGSRLKMIIDDSGTHGKPGSGEDQAEVAIVASAGRKNVIRQSMRNLQHNKMIVVTGPNIKKAIGGSTNHSWRGFYVQNNNAVIVQGAPVDLFVTAFDAYFSDETTRFEGTNSPKWHPLGLTGIDAQLTFSPHSDPDATLYSIGKDMLSSQSSILYSLAFLYQTKGSIRSAVTQLTDDDDIFVYGISDKKVGGLNLQHPDGNVAPVFPQELSINVPEPFKSEPSGNPKNVGVRMHHKFVVIDFDKPTARVYTGSYNFSPPADTANGENLFLIKDRKVAISYMIEAIRIFDHYNFRVKVHDSENDEAALSLKKPPTNGNDPWWASFFRDPHQIKDRNMFGG